MDPDTGIFNCPLGGSYMFVFHIATHDNKKALLSIRVNGEEVASVFDQNHKDNHKNSMAGTTIGKKKFSNSYWIYYRSEQPNWEF